MRKVVFVAACLILVSCVTVRSIDISPVEVGAESDSPVTIESPVKVHLVDGSTVMFPKGMTIEGGRIDGQGFKYDLTLQNSEPVTVIDLDDVAAMESYQDVVNTGATVAATTVTTVGGGMAGIALVKAIFGSCPTTYSLEDGEPILEAESFSYSIAPGFEARDIDRLGIVSNGQTSIELEMRNEALETHYIDQVELLEIVHARGESAFPDPRGRPVIVADMRPPDAVVDRDGLQVDELVAAADGLAWGTSKDRLRQVSIDDMQDYIVAEFDVADSGDDLALVLRMRNSLLNTVLLYDVMLKDQGFAAIDWMGKDLDRLGPKYRLARWYRNTMGMQISVWERGEYRPVAKLADTGPIAWNEVAVPLPAAQDGKLRVRLSFVADNWRIDQVALASRTGKATVRTIPLAQVHSASGDEHSRARDNLSAADDVYVVTVPGDRLRLQFDVGTAPPGLERDWFLAAEGYYIEWMRRDWLQSTTSASFVPNDAALLAALGLWETQRDGLREQFEATKISVR